MTARRVVTYNRDHLKGDQPHMSTKANVARVVAMTAGFLLALALLFGSQDAGANSDYMLTVDGVQYAPVKVVGNGLTAHYFTPGGTPSTAFSERHQWMGNGSENLPCDGRLHWIDNKNRLVISHCEETSTTTTTTPTTTTTAPPTTTTTTTAPPTTTSTSLPSTTTTTEPDTTTTTVPETTTTTPGSTTTTTEPAPIGGVATGGGAAASEVCGCEGPTIVEHWHPAAWLLAGLIVLLAAAAYGLWPKHRSEL